MAINVRLAAGRIVIPDIVVGKFGRPSRVCDAADVALLSEITSPSEQYVEHAVALNGQTLASDQPFPIDIGTKSAARLLTCTLSGAHNRADGCAPVGQPALEPAARRGLHLTQRFQGALEKEKGS
jgi:hypothetical protein